MAAPQAKRRLLKDIERAQEQLMSEQGIYYVIDEDRVNKGFALLEGPENTPYEGCFLLFSFLFPDDYPFSPPRVLFLTTDGKTRFHPNLYIDGKVCLSILGTYSGPSWSGTQSLSTILLSLQGLLDTNPLAHEPAFERGTLHDYRHKQYADAVEHNMIRLMLQSIQRFEEDPERHEWSPFQDIIQTKLPQIKEKLRQKILAKAKYPEILWNSLVYGMSCRSYYKSFLETTPWIKQSKIEWDSQVEVDPR
jgi:ubiquitin-protein ligase